MLQAFVFLVLLFWFAKVASDANKKNIVSNFSISRGRVLPYFSLWDNNCVTILETFFQEDFKCQGWLFKFLAPNPQWCQISASALDPKLRGEFPTPLSPLAWKQASVERNATQLFEALQNRRCTILVAIVRPSFGTSLEHHMFCLIKDVRTQNFYSLGLAICHSHWRTLLSGLPFMQIPSPQWDETKDSKPPEGTAALTTPDIYLAQHFPEPPMLVYSTVFPLREEARRRLLRYLSVAPSDA